VTTVDDTSTWLALLYSDQLNRRVAKHVIQKWVVENGRDLGAIYQQGSGDLARVCGISLDQAQQVLATQNEVSAQDVKLEQMGAREIYVVSRAGAAFPPLLSERLPEEQMPYVLFCSGSLTTVTQPGVAILGNDQPTSEARQVTEGLVQGLIAEDHTIVGGYDRGVDRHALENARDLGGQAAIVLPLGMDHLQPVIGRWGDARAEERAVFMSPYPSETPFDERLARAREIIMIALCEVVILVAPKDKPADTSWQSAFRKWGGQILVWTGTDAEVAREWIEGGALPFDDAIDALEHVRQRLGGILPPAEEGEMGEEAGLDLPGVEPIGFENADQAIEMLGRSGNVPASLIRRLRQAEEEQMLEGGSTYDGWPDPDADLGEGESENEGDAERA
jgi:DNA processing protein